jgi:hypothetical protein
MANFPTIAIGLPFIHAGGFSTQALAWKSSIVANGGSITDAELAAIDNNFFKPAVANGSILTQLDRLNIYAGLSNSIAQRTCIIRGSLITPVSSPTFDVNGVKSSGTSYLNLNYNPAVNAVKLTLNSASHGYFVKNPPFTATVRAMGAQQGLTAPNTRLSLTRDSNISSAFNNDNNGNSNTSIVTSGWVCCEGQRIDSSTGNFSIINGTYNAVTRTSVGLPNSATTELTEFNEVVPRGNYDTMYHGASWHGWGGIDNVNLQTLLRNTFTALGV